MDFTVIAIVGLNFVFTVAVVILVTNMSSSLKSQNLSTSFLKNQLTYLYERLGEISEKADKRAETDREQLERVREELNEVIRQGRTEFLRENDNIKFGLKQIQERMEAPTKR